MWSVKKIKIDKAPASPVTTRLPDEAGDGVVAHEGVDGDSKHCRHVARLGKAGLS